VLDQLPRGQVQWAPSPFERQSRECQQLLLSLDEDALLRPFRLRASQAAPGADMGGWYDADAFAPASTFGQWISALSRFYAASGDAPTRAKVDRLIRGYAATIESDGRFYRNNRFPAYTYDKLVSGLVDAHRAGASDDALAVLRQTTRAAVPHLPDRAVPRNEQSQPGEDFTRHAWDESYTLPEAQFLAWHATGDEAHLELGKRFLYDDFFSALAAGENVLPGKHAYSHVNALGSAAQAHLTLHTPMHLQAASEGFSMIEAQSYATGGWGPDEHFVVPGSGSLGASLADCKRSFETPCGAYAHIKLARYLLRITHDPRYGDSMERVLYNTVMGATPLQHDGHAFYYSDYSRTAQKIFFWDRWPCCSGTLPLVAADYAINLCFTDASGLYVNLYAPATVSWQQGGHTCQLKMSTEYPYAGIVTFALASPTALRFTLRLRIPAWTSLAQVSVNGRQDPVICLPGTFATLDREWHPGDRVVLELSMPLRLLAVDSQHPHLAALIAGPLVLMRRLDETGNRIGMLNRNDLLAARQLSAAAHEWKVTTPDAVLAFLPFMDIHDEPYRMYQHIV
jgi:DUF1680 family protein